MSETIDKRKNAINEVKRQKSQNNEENEDSNQEEESIPKSEHRGSGSEDASSERKPSNVQNDTAQQRAKLQQQSPQQRVQSMQLQQQLSCARTVPVKKQFAKQAFAKFRQLDQQNSSTGSLKVPGRDFRFKLSEVNLKNNAATVKERLLAWCQSKTKEYENVQLDNFSTAWSNGLGFCALIHHFRPDAFDYSSLQPENRRKNFELAFTTADEVAGITPLLDVEDMVMMSRPDWKCVFTYVQSIYRRFKDED